MTNTPEVDAEYFLARGYVEVQEIGEFKIGQRVCNTNQVYSKARQDGTAVLERIFHAPGSLWEKKYGQPDIEVIVRRDDPAYGGTHGVWASYGTIVAKNQPPTPNDVLTTALADTEGQKLVQDILDRQPAREAPPERPGT